MAVFVLVHGAWHGGWCWADTASALRAMGHEVHTPTLTGLGERSHLLSADVTSDTHVQDVVNVLRWWELTDVILVGHSYGGSIITGVAGQVPERLRAMVYLDAVVQDVSGEGIFVKASPARMAGFQKQIDAGAIGLEPDGALENWTKDPEKKAWLKRMCTPHPAATLQRGVTLSGREAEVVHKHYIIAEKNEPSIFWKNYDKIQTRPGWTHERMPYWHDVMVEAPEHLAERLDAYAAALPAIK